MTDKDFLVWIKSRFIEVYGVNPNTDYIHRLDEIIQKQDSLKIPEYIDDFMKLIPESFINCNKELILDRKWNVYFRLKDVYNEMDFKCKIFSWLSRPIIKELPINKSNKLLKAINKYLNTSFSVSDFEYIYTKLGNSCNNDLSIKFINSNYDIKLLQNNS